MPTQTEQYNSKLHFSTKLTSIKASLKNNEGYVYEKLLDSREKLKPKFTNQGLVRTADLRRFFSKRATTNCSYKLNKITQFIKGTTPSYHIDNLSERYTRALLRKTHLTLKDNKAVMKNLNLYQINMSLPAYTY